MQNTPRESRFWRSDRFFRLLVENAKEYAIFAMDPEGRITIWNVGAERLFGWSEEEALGRSGAIIFTQEDRRAGTAEEEMAFARRQDYVDDTRWHVKKNGERFWASATMEAIRDEQGELVGFAKILRDLTDVKRHKEALDQKAELERSNRSLEVFASHVAHEMRSPMMGMRLVIRSLLRRYTDVLDEETLKMVRETEEDIVELDEFAANLLAYARLGGAAELERAPVDSEELFNKVLSKLQGFIKERGAEVEIAGDLPMVWADPVQLRHLLHNLIANAIEHNDAAVPRVRVEAEDAEDVWLFRVRDNGLGIPEEKRATIFDLFQQGREGGGVGVGLALAGRIVEAHDGRIWVDSVPGCGSTFFFTLPKRPHDVQ